MVECGVPEDKRHQLTLWSGGKVSQLSLGRVRTDLRPVAKDVVEAIECMVPVLRDHCADASLADARLQCAEGEHASDADHVDDGRVGQQSRAVEIGTPWAVLAKQRVPFMLQAR